MGLGPLVTDLMKQEMQELRNNGYTLEEIAKQCGVGLSTVSRYTHKPFDPRANGPVKYYKPDYDRNIQVIKKQAIVEYGGIEFVVDYNERKIILPEILQDETEYDINNIEDLKHLGQALISIASSFNSLILDGVSKVNI